MKDEKKKFIYDALILICLLICGWNVYPSKKINTFDRNMADQFLAERQLALKFPEGTALGGTAFGV